MRGAEKLPGQAKTDLDIWANLEGGQIVFSHLILNLIVGSTRNFKKEIGKNNYTYLTVLWIQTKKNTTI